MKIENIHHSYTIVEWKHTFISSSCIQIERHWSQNLSWICNISFEACRFECINPHSRQEKLFLVGSGGAMIPADAWVEKSIGDIGGERWVPTNPTSDRFESCGCERVVTVIGFDIATAFEMYSCFGMIIRWSLIEPLSKKRFFGRLEEIWQWVGFLVDGRMSWTSMKCLRSSSTDFYLIHFQHMCKHI